MKVELGTNRGVRNLRGEGECEDCEGRRIDNSTSTVVEGTIENSRIPKVVAAKLIEALQ